MRALQEVQKRRAKLTSGFIVGLEENFTFLSNLTEWVESQYLCSLLLWASHVYKENTIDSLFIVPVVFFTKWSFKPNFDKQDKNILMQ